MAAVDLTLASGSAVLPDNCFTFQRSRSGAIVPKLSIVTPFARTLALLLLLGARMIAGAPADEVKEFFSEGKKAPSGNWEKRCSFGPGRILHSAIWTYSEMIIWGGGSEHQFYSSGGVYDPGSDRWRSMSERGAPSGRWGHAAVWTGREMIVWGGRSSFTPAGHHRDGAIYDPRTDSWRPMTQEGAPSGRSQMAAVWTGEQLIVWGGWADGGQCPATGAAYDPRIDRWTDLPVDNTPEGRVEPACVWTGREMIVWGGLLEGERRSTATGARYDPETRRWTPLPADGAPAPARGHSAIWTGREFMVWGGANVDETSGRNIGTNSGAVYSSAENHWHPIPVSAALHGRLYHVAAWTDTELVVWGGGDQETGCLASGGIFNPNSGSWRAVSEEGGPSARSMSTAVWTGEGMLIYGGSTGGTSAFAETYFLRLGPE
jgi:N-acetylneuraminic acid mutarotase